ncbi:hypothetical protein [Hydrococcus rivularis]|uniref:hypothetical protein n=1 Tax=Hydrococcus rivularis TaxID=1616834 RepID=UPI0015881EF9|nr:hypothetical protein [Hydrococcus rivularis]
MNLHNSIVEVERVSQSKILSSKIRRSPGSGSGSVRRLRQNLRNAVAARRWN